MQAKIKVLLFVIILLVVLYYFKSSRSSFGFGAGQAIPPYWPDPANGAQVIEEEPGFYDQSISTGIPGGLPYTPGSSTCYNSIPKIGFENTSSSDVYDLEPLNNPGATSASADNELQMFQNFMNYQWNIKNFMDNNIQVVPILVNKTNRKLADGATICTIDTSNTSMYLFNALVTANGGPVTAGYVSISKDTGIGGTVSLPGLVISLNQAVSIPKLNRTDIKYFTYMKARMAIIIGVLNALHYIYSPSTLDPSFTPNYTSSTNSGPSFITDTSNEYIPTDLGGNKTPNKYVGIIQELYNNYGVDQSPDSTTVEVKEYEISFKRNKILALTPNAKRAVWTYLYARDAWIQDTISGFIDVNGIINNLGYL